MIMKKRGIEREVGENRDGETEEGREKEKKHMKK